MFPNDVHPDYPVATAYGADGVPVDYLGDHEPARSYAAQGFRVVVHAGDGPYSREELQEVVDHELQGFTDSRAEMNRAS